MKFEVNLSLVDISKGKQIKPGAESLRQLMIETSVGTGSNIG